MATVGVKGLSCNQVGISIDTPQVAAAFANTLLPLHTALHVNRRNGIAACSVVGSRLVYCNAVLEGAPMISTCSEQSRWDG